jgi:hypothetical protein
MIIERKEKDVKWLIFRHWRTNSIVQNYDYKEKGNKCRNLTRSTAQRVRFQAKTQGGELNPD